MIIKVVSGIDQVNRSEGRLEPPSELAVEINFFIIGIVLGKKPEPQIIGKVVIDRQDIQQGAVFQPYIAIGDGVGFKV